MNRSFQPLNVLENSQIPLKKYLVLWKFQKPVHSETLTTERWVNFVISYYSPGSFLLTLFRPVNTNESVSTNRVHTNVYGLWRSGAWLVREI